MVRFGGQEHANPPFGQTHGEPPTAQGSFGCGGPRALEGRPASAGGSEGTARRSLLHRVGSTSGGMSLGLKHAARGAAGFRHGPSDASAPGGLSVRRRRSERDRDLEGDKSPWMDRMCGVGNGGRTSRTRQRSKALKLGCFFSNRATASPGNGRHRRRGREADSGRCAFGRATATGSACSLLQPRRRTLGFVRGVAGHQQLAVGRSARARSNTARSRAPASVGSKERASMLTSWQVSRLRSRHSYQAFRLRQPESSLR